MFLFNAFVYLQVMDIVLHCVDPGHLKSRGLNEVFPSICGFPQVSHCPHTRRIATGAKNGSVAMYELRVNKCQVSGTRLKQTMAHSCKDSLLWIDLVWVLPCDCVMPIYSKPCPSQFSSSCRYKWQAAWRSCGRDSECRNMQTDYSRFVACGRCRSGSDADLTSATPLISVQEQQLAVEGQTFSLWLLTPGDWAFLLQEESTGTCHGGQLPADLGWNLP